MVSSEHIFFYLLFVFIVLLSGPVDLRAQRSHWNKRNKRKKSIFLSYHTPRFSISRSRTNFQVYYFWQLCYRSLTLSQHVFSLLFLKIFCLLCVVTEFVSLRVGNVQLFWKMVSTEENPRADLLGKGLTVKCMTNSIGILDATSSICRILSDVATEEARHLCSRQGIFDRSLCS